MTHPLPDLRRAASNERHDVHRELQVLRQRIDELEAMLAAKPGAEPDANSDSAVGFPVEPVEPVDNIETPHRSTRRGLLGAAAAAAAAGVAVVAAPTRVAAGTVNGESVDLGVVNVASQTTEIRYDFPIGGNPRSGVLVVNDGVWLPQAPQAPNNEDASSRGSIVGLAGNNAVHAMFGMTNSVTRGASGGRFVGESAIAYGVVASGRRATIHLDKPVSGMSSPPPDRGDAHNDGELTIDANNDVWICVEAGLPGVWRKVTGPAAAGAFHAIAPVRVFDSRQLTTPGSGRFSAGTSRVISVKDGRNGQTEMVDAPDVVPKGATSVTFNLTVTNTDSPGFAFIAPSEVDVVGASTINWTGAGASVANGGVVKLGGDRQLRVFCEVSGADVIVDISGYFR